MYKNINTYTHNIYRRYIYVHMNLYIFIVYVNIYVKYICYMLYIYIYVYPLVLLPCIKLCSKAFKNGKSNTE